uniref:Chitin-binding type-1 domain-containing protein n=1 Tax=Chromera velia CCMP2878 TaxID=1169474 RepID=A0A0G4ICR4_9ALVE|eukprot:Cvel_13116.t1-p1 / transcript=Cvel_13116.t1 / gene=Cvel_13116 / organism=Chromera_velia_CCMP2878 / gene_product=Spindolin, putative / transcript_product=Spindolin, putative / location=Cvel_scaffold884:13274-14620(+) / protein_length=449 / sequence_SO=supercontig / SO=protein_coding / is_pseudo=false
MLPNSVASLLSLVLGFTHFHQGEAHGWAEFPKARQQFCYEDGTNGRWFNSFDNSACQAAFDVSGEYAMVQRNEFASNVLNFNDQQAVEAVVRDGLLCSGGDTRKAGMDVLTAFWPRTELAAGQTFTYRFRATAPHSPSFWRFYITKPDFNPATKALAWSDLEFLVEFGNIPVVNGFYTMDIQMPNRPEGSTATFYTRWQRDDPAGEGFYMCSDVTITGGTGTGTTTPSPETTTTTTQASSGNPQCSGAPCPNSSQCRSRWNFCGTTSAHCNDQSTWVPSCNGGTTPTTTTPAPSTTTTTTTQAATTASPPTSGQCGTPCPNTSLCRSKWGFCGSSPAYCNAESLWTPACLSDGTPTTTPTPPPTTTTPAPPTTTAPTGSAKFYAKSWTGGTVVGGVWRHFCACAEVSWATPFSSEGACLDSWRNEDVPCADARRLMGDEDTFPLRTQGK